MQITTATRTVEIYANTEAGVTYRNVKDGKATGPVRSANRATAKAGSVGREILDAIDALAAEEEAAERAAAPAEIAAPVIETAEIAAPVIETAEIAAPVAAPVANCPCAAAGRTRSTHHVNCPGEFAEIETGDLITVAGRTGRVTQVPGGATWVGVTWDTDTEGRQRPSYGYAYLDQIAKVQSRAADTIRRAVNLKW